MNWRATAKAKARAVMAGQETTTRAIFTATPTNWNRRDVWLTRPVKRDRTPESPVRDPATPGRHIPEQFD